MKMKVFKDWLMTIPIVTWKNFFIYLIIINLLGFLVMLIDKKKAERNKWRISEKTLFVITLMGGGIGTILGMYRFRHKTQKKKFTIGLPVILVMEIIFMIYFLII